ncbi:NAD(P)-dependent oxidoreductase [Mesorhizobium sp. B292B1B]|uniref:NAD(P)-dependent oxidoreductase n=1 Tax=unclassified Mesorhizobium TaxID=325217 RepID=UPI0011261874|nr:MULTISPECIES: NAD(P)-dependent oxidoreductase [unclassified Mesorhizobium]MBZ9966639.1 NAD(P)-dependent oxidoreductase [Mesorhizobium sp. BR1-1-2]MCA0014800.1 NAD(P)-dependent oxidoreductase [Mesorhizobium sp. B294B1A1]MCA0041079.1 NAD(P)-dependent oxidoreductase [Mesorhizobium sp. B292B1B]TPM42658.1 NAD(P)-dependent oxidoreductase [Mesorhizobium sp. B2-3-2]
MKERIGFIGLGSMGSGMAANLLQKGWPLTVCVHRSRDAADRLIASGAVEAASPRDLAAACDIVILCVTGSREVEMLVKKPDGLAAAGKPLLVIDCSTSNPSSTTALAGELAAQGVMLIDAPLARTPKEAAEGKLDVMVGGSAEAVARARPVLEAFAARIVHTGPIGSGHTMKLLNNFVSMGYSAIYSEALTLGVKAGLTPQVFNSVISGSRMDCGFYQAFFDFVLNRNENAQRFAIVNALKDMTYLASFAQAAGVANPIGASVRNGFATAVATGHGEKFVPALSDIIAGLNGVSLVEPPEA